MKHVILRSVWLSIAVYALLMGVWGPSGIKASQAADAQRVLMNSNLVNLQTMHDLYTQELAAYHSGTEVIGAEARRLGYLTPNEVVLRLDQPGQEASAGPRIPGTSVDYKSTVVISDLNAKKIALAGGGIALLLLLVLELLFGRRKGKPV
ncbi:MAG: septum formation initiator family protein [Spirochaetes bacterium]|nr:septum formation initiator family protein [Spirochaetota bacterium]